MLTATFSNGTTDVYKGSRKVTAAWAIIHKATGQTLNSGHSLDAEKARKTAMGNVHYLSSEKVLGQRIDSYYIPTQRVQTIGSLKWVMETARAAGWNGKGKAVDYLKGLNAARTAALSAAVTIEVVAL